MKNIFTLILVVCSSIQAFSQQKYLLESELFTSYAGNASKTLTWYSYDNEGKRSLSRSFTGDDTLASMTSSVLYSYYPTGHLESETYLAGTDTTERLLYFYNNMNLLISIQKYNHIRLLTFKDSLFYTESRLLEKRIRLKLNGDTSFYVTYQYENNLIISDSSYQFDITNSTFTPQQIHNYNYNSDGSIAFEAEWTLTGGRFSAKTTAMNYRNGNLSSSVRRAGTSISGQFEDSVSYSHDDKGNCIRKENFEFTDAITLISAIDFRWRSAATYTLLNKQPEISHQLSLSVLENNIIIKGANLSNASFHINDISGRKLIYSSRYHDGEAIIKIPSLAPGMYFLFIKTTSGNSLLHFLR